MRSLVFATAAALVLSTQLVASAEAQDTTTIKKDNDAGQSTTIIKKHEDRPFLAVPSAQTEKKVIIHKDRDDD